MIASHLLRVPADKDKVLAVVSSMEATLARGGEVSFPTAQGSQSSVDADRRLERLRRAATEPRQALLATGPIVGGPISSGYAWRMDLHIYAGPCGPSGCSFTDHAQFRETVNPGAVTSRVDYNITGIHPNLTGLHIDVYPQCNNASTDCGLPAQSNSAYLSGSVYPSTFSARNGADLAHYVQAWAYIAPAGFWHYDHGRTDNAFCHTYDNVCTY